ncbi:MAG TPA: glutathione peroxidase, partial [Paenibacillus sp.]|nr:glutathione peroxidase [Paenibacillus sp.]
MKMSAYDYVAISQDGQEVQLEKYKGQVALFVNTASKCG